MRTMHGSQTRRIGAMVALALTLWVAQDILVWERIFEARKLYQYDPIYQFWHYAFLVAMLVGGALWLRGAAGAVFAAASWTLANSGLADVLYYWLSLRQIPETLPWLDAVHPLVWFHPATTTSVIASSLIWIGIWLALAYLENVVKKLVHRDVEGVIVGGRLHLHGVLTRR